MQFLRRCLTSSSSSAGAAKKDTPSRGVPMPSLPSRRFYYSAVFSRPALRFVILPSLLLLPVAVHQFRNFATASPKATANAAIPSLTFDAAGFAIPHPDKANKPGGCGEDAFFVSPTKTALGVADGVGGWGEVGVDPSEYSRCLMSSAAAKVAAAPNSTPMEVIKHAHGLCRKITGSATALIVTLQNGTLHGVNVGDSGCMVVRGNKPILRTKEQQKSFNFPYQLGTNGDDPETGDKYQLEVKNNDVVVLGTDGVWDNLHDDEVLSLIKQWATEKRASVKLAESIAQAASKTANNPKADTPFAKNAKLAGRRFDGGKLDDITVVVGVVRGSEHP